jgi:hypothetical protein
MKKVPNKIGSRWVVKRVKEENDNLQLEEVEYH